MSSIRGVAAFALATSLLFPPVAGFTPNTNDAKKIGKLQIVQDMDGRRSFITKAVVGIAPVIAFFPGDAIAAAKRAEIPLQKYESMSSVDYAASLKAKYTSEPNADLRDMFRKPAMREKLQKEREERDPKYVELKAKRVEEERLLAEAEAEKEKQRIITKANAPPDAPRILVLGGTGYIGKEVRKKLERGGIFVVATSRNGRDGTVALDINEASFGKVESQVRELIKENKCSAVISCIGAIGTDADLVINGAAGQAALGAIQQPSVRNFVALGVSPDTKAAIPKGFEDYVKAKSFSCGIVISEFGGKENGVSYTLINPGKVEKSKTNYGGGASVPLDTIVDAILVGATAFYTGEESAVLDTPEQIKAQAAKFTKVKETLFTAANSA